MEDPLLKELTDVNQGVTEIIKYVTTIRTLRQFIHLNIVSEHVNLFDLQ